VGGGAGGFPPGGCGGSFEVDADGLDLTGSVVPLGFLYGGAGSLVVEDNDVVCMDRGGELEALVFVGGGAGAFPFDTGGVAVTAPLIYLQFTRLSVTYRDASADVMPTFLICVNPARVPVFRNLPLSRYLATIS